MNKTAKIVTRNVFIRYAPMLILIKKIALLWAFMLVFWSCGNEQNVLFQFEMETQLRIAPGLNTFETFYFPINRVPTNVKNFIGSVDKADIQSIFPSRAKITASFSEYDWSNVQEVIIYALDVNNPEFPQEIFYQKQNEIKFFRFTVDLKEIMLEDVVNIEVAFRFRNITPAEINTRINMTFFANGL